MTLYYESELYHYGVPGMKWGRRKSPERETARQNYKSAKKDLRSARKAYNRNAYGLGVDGIARAQKYGNKMNRAELNTINAKAKYNAAKAKNSEKAAKAEFKTYRKEMSKNGLAGSIKDQQSGGKSTRLYKEIRAKKGKEYADRVAKKTQNMAYAQVAAGSAVAVGSYAVAAYLAYKK